MAINQIDLSIGVVNTNNRDIMLKCLKSIFETVKKVTFEIIVVDNNSTDGSVESIQKNFPEVIVVPLTQRNGYGFCLNRAFEKSKGKYFLALNEDIIFLTNTIEIMVEKIKNNPSIGALGCKILNPDGTLQRSCSRFPTLLTEIYESVISPKLFSKIRMSREIPGWNFDSERDVDIICGCCMLIPRSVIEEIGFFDERFYLFSDEIDLCKRIRNKGLKIHFTPEAQIIHYGALTTKTMSVKSYIMYLDSRCKYFKKHYGRVYERLEKINLFIRVSIRLIGWWIVLFSRIKRNQVAREKVNVNYKAFLWFLHKNNAQL